MIPSFPERMLLSVSIAWFWITEGTFDKEYIDSTSLVMKSLKAMSWEKRGVQNPEWPPQSAVSGVDHQALGQELGSHTRP